MTTIKTVTVISADFIPTIMDSMELKNFGISANIPDDSNKYLPEGITLSENSSVVTFNITLEGAKKLAEADISESSVHILRDLKQAAKKFLAKDLTHG